MNTITLLTDFGLKDPYVGIMKGVMASINPQLLIVDMSHQVEAQDVREACFLVDEYYRYFTKGVIHLCVIDPTVGSQRRPLIVARESQFFVGPDNGLFSLLLDDAAVCYEITNRRYMRAKVSATFHGRDVFAPAAAYLSLGVSPSSFGPPVLDPVRLTDLDPSVDGDTISGTVIRFDHFGNAISNVSSEVFTRFLGGAPCIITIKDLVFQSVSRSYYEGDYTCVVGSNGYLEFGLFNGNFAQSKGVQKGERVTVTKVKDEKHDSP